MLERQGIYCHHLVDAPSQMTAVRALRRLNPYASVAGTWTISSSEFHLHALNAKDKTLQSFWLNLGSFCYLLFCSLYSPLESMPGDSKNDKMMVNFQGFL